MKTKIIILMLVSFSLSLSTYSQISLKKIFNKGVEKAEQSVEDRIETRVDNGIDNTLDGVEDGIDDAGETITEGGKDKDKDKAEEEDEDEMVGGSTEDETELENDGDEPVEEETVEEEKPKKPNQVWSKYDFVPGDKIIFEDGPDIMEENGEFPSRWDLIQGQVEIGNVDGENVIMFLDGGEIIPYLENSSEDYLPEVFTIEFDFYKPEGGNRLSFYLRDNKNQANSNSERQEFDVTPIRVDAPKSGYVMHPNRGHDYCEGGCWVHISIAYTKGKLKVYIDDTRLVNIPHYEFNPTGFTLYPYFASSKEDKTFYVKNIRIAEGGVKYYDRVMSEGKIVANGIRFDTGKATLKPESMGPINKVYELMVKQPSLNFSVEGHTDSDGDDVINQKLSLERAKTVMNKLIEMGIEKSRLKYNGFGESKPMVENTSSEGKAQNRRVEFVKF